MSFSCFMLIAGEETESAEKYKTFGRNRISLEIPPSEGTATSVPFFFACFLRLVCWRRMPHKSGQLWISLMNRNVASRSSSLSAIFGKCHADRVNRVRDFIGWQLPKHVCQSFKRQIRVYQQEKVGEKVGENRVKFYLSPTACQRVFRLFLCRSHTPTWVCPNEFANFYSLPCEGRFKNKLARLSFNGHCYHS